MQFTISQLRDYLWCEQYAHNLHTLRRGRQRTSRALWLGELFHHCMANRLRGLPATANLPSEQLDPGVEDEFQRMLPFLHAWQVPPTWRVHGVEAPYTVQVGRHALTCRPDAVITDQTGRWLAQWKSLGRSGNLGTHQERVRLSWHECGYHYAMDQQPDIPSPILGTILGTYKKLSARDLAAGREPFTLIRLPRSHSEVLGVVTDMASVADRMEESIQRNQHLKNLDACFGRFGNSQCQFYDVCHGASSLKDPPFTDLPDRYADLVQLGDSDDV